jgi:hypothetical protein
VKRSATADVPFTVMGVPFRRGGAASSDPKVSFSFIQANDMPISALSGFLLAVKCFKTRPQNRTDPVNHYRQVLRCASP